MARKQITDQADELDWAFASDIAAQRRQQPVRPTAILDAVRDTWPNSNPHYQQMIVKRYLCFDMPDADAVLAILRGYSSPSAAMAARVIRRRKQIREIEDVK